MDLTKEGERCGTCGTGDNKAYLNCQVKGCATLEYSVTEVNLYTKQNLPEGLQEISKHMNVKIDGDIIIVKTLSKFGFPEQLFEFINSENSIQKVMEHLRALENHVVGYNPSGAVKKLFSVFESQKNDITIRFRHDELTHKGTMKMHKGDLLIVDEKDFKLLRKTDKPFGI